MAEGADVVLPRAPAEEELDVRGGEGAGGSEEMEDGGGLTDAQREVLERCLHALNHAKNDSHTLAALLLITRLCPANQLDKPTLRRIFEAVGLNLPARLLVTAVRGSDSSALPPHELLSLGAALLAALSTDADMASHPQLLSTVPLLLGILANGSLSDPPAPGADAQEETPAPAGLDEAVAADCYQVLTAVCALPQGPDQLLSRGAVPSLCRAAERGQSFGRERALPLLGCLLSGKTKDKAWRKHPAELGALLRWLCRDFCRATNQGRLDMCPLLVKFLPPEGGEELRADVGGVWAALRPMVQAKLAPRHVGAVLVLAACLLDLCGWEPAGPPKFCCLLVNRACVEVRLGLEEPPGGGPGAELQHTLTGCYRIMEAAMEQACGATLTQAATPLPPGSAPSLTLQQSRQVLGVLEEAFSAVIYYLQQVDASRYGEPFVFATFRALCSWLAEETSCLREEVSRLLPVLIDYARRHLQGEAGERGLPDWTADAPAPAEGAAWTGKEPMRYLLPALCHLSAEEAPRKVLLTLDTPALLVDFLSRSWAELKGKGGAAWGRDPSMETACSALLNFTVTEAERVKKDPCFRALETLLSEALPVLAHKPHLLVLAANCCTLGLMIGRLRAAPAGSMEAAQRRILSSALRFLRGALDSGGGGSGPAAASPAWEESWDEAAELWRLSLQALGGCVRARPQTAALVRDEGWLEQTLAVLGESGAPPDQHTRAALEEALCAVAESCPLCRREIRDAMATGGGGALGCMRDLEKAVGGE